MSAHPSLGVEEELLLVDSATGDPLPRNRPVAAVAADRGVNVQLEFTKAQVEINTPVCWTAAEVRRHLLTMRATVSAAAQATGGRLLAVGVPPVGRLGHLVTEKPRYREIRARYGELAREQAVCGCHVHVGVPDRETAVQVSNHLRPWLPILLALTANSSIYLGADTGFASWRAIMAWRWPCSGPPPQFDSADHYEALVGMLIDSGALLDEQMVYWDVRPSSHLPTVEVRVSDVPGTVEETVLLTTLVRALVMTAQASLDRGEPVPVVEQEVLCAGYWIGAREGLSGPALDVSRARPLTAAAVLDLLLRHVRPALEELGEDRYADAMVRQILARGNGAMRQRVAYHRSGDALDVVALVAQDTLADLSRH